MRLTSPTVKRATASVAYAGITQYSQNGIISNLFAFSAQIPPRGRLIIVGFSLSL